jgi:hypothetical protein
MWIPVGLGQSAQGAVGKLDFPLVLPAVEGAAA